MTDHSFKAILQDYRSTKLQEELWTDWGSLVFYRLPAFAVAKIAVILGASAKAITLVGLLLIPIIAALAWALPPEKALPWMIAAAIAFNILDCADGTVARATQTTSLSGAYLDFATDVLYRSAMLASVGLVTDRLYPGAAFPWLAIGLLCGFMATYARLNRSHIRTYKLSTTAENIPPNSTPNLIYAFLSGLDTLLPLLALCAWIFGVLNLLLLCLLLYTSIDAAIAVIENYKLLSQHDKTLTRRQKEKP